ncbi:MAG: putative Ig domain-containing protein, partial [Bacteroidales bacterium]
MKHIFFPFQWLREPLFFLRIQGVLSAGIILLSLCSIGNAQVPPDSIYFGQTPPGDSAIVFAPGIISLDGRNERTPDYLPDYSAFYFTSGSNDFGESYVYQTVYDTMWGPTEINPAFTDEAWDLSITDSSLACFTSRVGSQTDIFIIERTDGNWGTPEKLPKEINSGSQEWGACILQNRTVYFCRFPNNQGEMFKCVYSDGEYLPAEELEINTSNQEWDPYIPEDESYIIFKSNRPGTYGNLDLYISYTKEDGTYTNPKNLGKKINSVYHDDGGNLTPDGKYFLFASGDPNSNNRDIYWVSSGFIDSLRLTNFVPYARYPIPDVTDTLGNEFSYFIPDSTFMDDDETDTLSIHAKLTNGEDLPGWLTFDTVTYAFSGTPAEPASMNIRVTVTDPEGATGSDVFRLAIIERPSTIDQS